LEKNQGCSLLPTIKLMTPVRVKSRKICCYKCFEFHNLKVPLLYLKPLHKKMSSISLHTTKGLEWEKANILTIVIAVNNKDVCAWQRSFMTSANIHRSANLLTWKWDTNLRLFILFDRYINKDLMLTEILFSERGKWGPIKMIKEIWGKPTEIGKKYFNQIIWPTREYIIFQFIAYL
jgi:hypothetical protein